ncbi:MAG: T9SS type A sorting domain-containing protein, partial [Proteobacteria bacterium]|nr:T9SS type A sorting domain-containing protein [Pseudomonadota bacterium]
NPFNPSTTIQYALHSRTHAALLVYNILGQRVAELVNEEKDAGSYEIQFDASGLASGVYLYRLEAGSFVQTRKLVVLK